jgi:auxin efflux carrier family protein
MPISDYFSSPTSIYNRQILSNLVRRDQSSLVDHAFDILKKPAPHSGHPDFGHLTLLVFEAVLEVVCVSLPGYIVARQGMFDAEAQKMMANLNVMLFTPCLIFTKLASQLTAEKLADLAIIPVIFVVQTLVSYACAWIIGRVMKFKKRQANFVIAMGVFGNSNSLPISLVLSLSKTLKGLHWDKVPNDNDEEVGARGILYLLIFQQLGQLLRWSWGYNVLLAPPDQYTEAEGGIKKDDQIERGRGNYRDHDSPRLPSPSYDGHDGSDDFEPYEDEDDDQTRIGTESPTTTKSDGLKTPRTPHNRSSGASPDRPMNGTASASTELDGTPANGMVAPRHHLDYPAWLKYPDGKKYDEQCGGIQGYVNQAKNFGRYHALKTGHVVRSRARRAFGMLPKPLQKGLSFTGGKISGFFAGVWEFMNPPLWAMLVAIIVASVPYLQHLFFDKGTFLANSATRAVQQSGGVAVPLILVVLGGNLARNTIPKNQPGDITDPREEKRLLYASLMARMVFPTIIMAPFLALVAKYVPVSIVDDKIFIVVAFLLTGAPSALQLSAITQTNNVYPTVMSNILFQSYVVWILPSTLILVLLALETVEWATT